MIIIAPKIDVNGERWFSPMEGLRLKVASIGNHQYRSRNALVRRHIEKLEASYNVGTSEFKLDDIGDVDAVDELLIDICTKFVLKDWEGVGEVVDGKEVATEYTPEKGSALLRLHPELYWKVLVEASDIAQGKVRQAEETAGKP